MSTLDPGDDHRAVSTALRVGATLLAAGATTDDVERAIRRVAIAGRLTDVQVAVTMGILTMSAVGARGWPVTQVRIVGERVNDYRRLSLVAALVDRAEDGGFAVEAIPAEIDRIDHLPPTHRPWVFVLASAVSSAAATVLFGGDAMDALATLLIGVVVEPIVRRLERSALPEFFNALLGPFLAVGLAIVLVALGAPIDGGLVITGSILRFLPGAAIVAGMRDLIDRSIISGSARLAEALLLGSGVAFGAGLAVRLGTALGGPTLSVGEVGLSGVGQLAQAAAAGVACATFALRLGVERRQLLSVLLLGGGAWLVTLVTTDAATGDLVPVIAAAVVVGVVGQALALRARLPSVIWTVPAVLPLLPGLTMVTGILEVGTIEGVLTVVLAIATGFALGAGVAFGSILVTVARRAGEVTRSVVLPVIGEAGAGLARSGERRPRRRPPEEDRDGGDGTPDG
ncbi:MAG: threonine/serine exporter family protein [Candidatus Limnocylindrales bacterium]